MIENLLKLVVIVETFSRAVVRWEGRVWVDCVYEATRDWHGHR